MGEIVNSAKTIERTLTIAVAGYDLHVKLLSQVDDATNSDRPVIVFLHEGLGSVGQWKSFPDELCRATGCDGVMYDRRGHGKSSAMHEPRDLDYFQHEAEVFLKGLLTELNIKRPILFGHSDGATIALKYASAFPDEPVAVISEAAHVIIEDIILNGNRAAQKQYADTDLRLKLARYHGDNTDALFWAWVNTWLTLERADWNMLADLCRITCPVLIVQGEDDQYGSRLQVDSIAEHVSGPSDILWITKCGHVPHLQARGRVIARSSDLISALSQSL